MCDFSVVINKAGAKQGVLFDAVSMDTQVNNIIYLI